MKKFMPILRLVFFCIAIFAISFGALLLKSGQLFGRKGGDAKDSAVAQKSGEGGEEPAGGEKTMKASVDGAPNGTANGAGERVGAGKTPKEKTIDPAVREKALGTGRALFSVAQPISISEASDLMLELARTKQEYEERKAALDLRDLELKQFSAELEQKRNAILKLAGDAQASGAGVNLTGKAEVLDKKTLVKIGKLFENMQPQAAAHALGAYPADRAAQILMNMKDVKVADVLSQMSVSDLVKITDAIGKLKESAADEE
jgi:flagellar motility protein MotE (MotC chaperone)